MQINDHVQFYQFGVNRSQGIVETVEEFTVILRDAVDLFGKLPCCIRVLKRECEVLAHNVDRIDRPYLNL